MKIKDFTNYMLNPIIKECITRGYNSAVAFTCLSQSALETGWLKSDLMRNNNAPYGIKYHLNNDRYYEAYTTEYIKGQKVKVLAKFQAYNNIEDATNDYFNLIASGRFKECLNAQTVKECVTILKNNNYATDPNYISSVLAVYDTIVYNLKN